MRHPRSRGRCIASLDAVVCVCFADVRAVQTLAMDEITEVQFGLSHGFVLYNDVFPIYSNKFQICFTKNLFYEQSSYVQ